MDAKLGARIWVALALVLVVWVIVFRTPPGTFQVSFKSKDHVSTIYDAEMPFSVFFNGGVAFHQGSLKVASHGCVHLSRTAAQKFFNSLSRGDQVQVKS